MPHFMSSKLLRYIRIVLQWSWLWGSWPPLTPALPPASYHRSSATTQSRNLGEQTSRNTWISEVPRNAMRQATVPSQILLISQSSLGTIAITPTLWLISALTTLHWDSSEPRLRQFFDCSNLKETLDQGVWGRVARSAEHFFRRFWWQWWCLE